MDEVEKNFLEGLEGRGRLSVKKQDVSVLREAAQNNIVLDDLELLPLAQSKKTTKLPKKEETWRHLDVSLSDMVNSFLATSERPVFLIRDDVLVYLNAAALQVLEIQTDKDVVGNRFFSVVSREDWKPLAETIGEMLTNGKTMDVRLKAGNGKIKKMLFQAVYLSEIEHFSFILFGEHPKKISKPVFNNLYDDLTGLPNFFLFEDRVHVAISLENAKENSAARSMIAVAALNIDNMDSFAKMHIEETILKKTAGNLVLTLPKSATVAVGLKYHFWVMLVGLKSNSEVNLGLKQIVEALSAGVTDNFTHHDLSFSIGVSLFPTIGNSSKKIIEQALSATKAAQIEKKPIVIFDPKL